ncbi:MAG: lipopolysaccharide biosynthesis protein, partial [Clostridia bacterium]|nr:lipopolysaccharide biosynthesis protein [Clostridia bacterium]
NSYVLDGVMTTLLSIEKYCKEPITAYVFTMDVTYLNPKFTPIEDDVIEFIDKMLKDTNSESRCVKVDVTELYKKELGGSPNEGSYCTPYTLLRLLADKVEGMPEDKLLYLDIDLMFNDDIRKLYNIDITDYEYAAAKDHYGKKLLHHDYINAGVLLFNMKKIKETKLLEKARKMINEKHMVFSDQSAIYNCTTKKLLLSQRFNDQKWLKKDTIIRHFCKTLKFLPYPRTVNIKPWKVSDIHKVFGCYQFDDVLYEYVYYKKAYEKQKAFKEAKDEQ